MTVKYLTRRSTGSFYYRREIPNDLKAYYDKREIKLSLKTSNERIAISKAQSLTKKYDAEFSDLRGTGERAEADKLLRKYGLRDAPKEDQDGYSQTDTWKRSHIIRVFS